MFLTRSYLKSIIPFGVGPCTQEIVTSRPSLQLQNYSPYTIIRPNNSYQIIQMSSSTSNKSTTVSSTPTTPTPPPNFHDVFSKKNREQTIINIHNKKTGFKFLGAIFSRKASVLIPLCYDKDGKPAILYTLRSLKMNKHSGEISFPGGASDPEDLENDITTALRETEEELGITRNSIDIWTTMWPIPALVSVMGVTPVLGFINLGNIDPDKLNISPNEVEKAFTISLEHLCNPINWEENVRMGFKMPAFINMNIRHRKINENDDDEPSPPEVKLWGLSGIITHITLVALVPDIYTRRISAFEGKPLTTTETEPEPISKL